MTFGEKLKTLRTQAGLTQEELADRLYVTRAAVSKWELDKGYPGIDSLKRIAEQFGCTIDELLSEEDAVNERRIEEARAKKMYALAVVAFAVAVIFALLAHFLAQPLFLIGAGCGCAAYLVFAFLSRPRFRRMKGNLVYRLVVFGAMFVLVVVITLAGIL